MQNNQRQHRTLHTQKDVLPYALCWLLCPVSGALASIFRMGSISTAYSLKKQRFSEAESEDNTPCRMTGVTLHSHVRYEEI